MENVYLNFFQLEQSMLFSVSLKYRQNKVRKTHESIGVPIIPSQVQGDECGVNHCRGAGQNRQARPGMSS